MNNGFVLLKGRDDGGKRFLSFSLHVVHNLEGKRVTLAILQRNLFVRSQLKYSRARNSDPKFNRLELPRRAFFARCHRWDDEVFVAVTMTHAPCSNAILHIR